MNDQARTGLSALVRLPSKADTPTAAAQARRIAELEAQNAMLRTELRCLGAILDGATEDAVVTLSLSGLVTRWSAGAERITGHAASEVLGRSAELLFTPEDRVKDIFAGELGLALEHGCATNERWHVRKDGTRFWASGSMLPLLDTDGYAQGFLNTFRDRTEGHAHAEHRELLVTEMSHRVRNLLTLVASIAAQTARKAPQPDEFLAAFNARLTALAQSQDTLGAAAAKGATLRDLLTRTLTFFDDNGERITLDGPAVSLPADISLMLGLVVQELATNALKHGALSVPEGRVGVSWVPRPGSDNAPGFEIAWTEHGGPPVTRPSREGVGSRLLLRGLGRQMGTTISLDFAPTGLECRMRIPLPCPAAF